MSSDIVEIKSIRLIMLAGHLALAGCVPRGKTNPPLPLTDALETWQEGGSVGVPNLNAIVPVRELVSDCHFLQVHREGARNRRRNQALENPPLAQPRLFSGGEC